MNSLIIFLPFVIYISLSFKPRVGRFFSVKDQINKFCVPHYLCHNHSTLPLKQESSHRQCTSEWAWMCSSKTLFIITSGLDLA